jgi:release factor glutamine methyltransferase
MVYEPDEDSYFLIDCLKKIVKDRKFNKVLEIGTGSGIASFSIAKFVGKILAVDINPKAIEIAEKERKKLGIKNIEFRVSNLFSNIKGKYDLIFFNPPYLPGKEDLSYSGGKNGEKIIVRFLGEVRNYLSKNGIAVILLSSFNNVKKLEKKFKLKLIKKKKLWFEELYCYSC